MSGGTRAGMGTGVALDGPTATPAKRALTHAI